MTDSPTGPAWQSLYDVAASQEGLFTTRQAAAAGYSDPLLAHHRKAGNIARIRRGIYRLVHFPPGEHEDLVAAWLWAESAAVLSHQTALSLHGLSDSLPAQIHLTLPPDWRQRRLRVPKGLLLHYADDMDAKFNQASRALPENEVGWGEYDRSFRRTFLRHIAPPASDETKRDTPLGNLSADTLDLFGNTPRD